jgi:hypothetical protein
MQYTVSMSSRMLVITALCLFLLCVLLFLLGIELGKRLAEPVGNGVTVTAPASIPVPTVPPLPQPSLPKP